MIRRNVDVMAIAILLGGLAIYVHARDAVRTESIAYQRIASMRNLCPFEMLPWRKARVPRLPELPALKSSILLP